MNPQLRRSFALPSGTESTPRACRPELSVFIEFEGRPVGVGMMLPDLDVLFRRMKGRLFPLGWAQFLLGRRALDAAVVQFIATDPSLQNQGIMRVLVAEASPIARRAHPDLGWHVDRRLERAQPGAGAGDGNARKHRLAVFARAL